MNVVIFWNCRGLGSPSSVNSLQSLVRKYSPEVLFLSETKSNSKEIQRLQNKLCFDKSVCFEAQGRAGGLVVFWKEDVELNIIETHEHYVDMHIWENRDLRWRMTCVYGWPEHNNKAKTWETINNLGQDNNLPWLVGGDFNEVLQDAEKRGGLPCDFNNLSAFRDCLDRNSLRDLGAAGHPFTWCNNRMEGLIEERLDRFVATENWRTLFPLAFVENTIWDGSDHYPIILYPKGMVENGKQNFRDEGKMFRLEARWTHHDTFDAEIEKYWGESKHRHGHSWVSVIEECGKRLKKWDKEVYRKNQNRLGWLLRRLKKVRKMAPTPAVIEEVRKVEQEMRQLRSQQETAAWQRCDPLSFAMGIKTRLFFIRRCRTGERETG